MAFNLTHDNFRCFFLLQAPKKQDIFDEEDGFAAVDDEEEVDMSRPEEGRVQGGMVHFSDDETDLNHSRSVNHQRKGNEVKINNLFYVPGATSFEAIHPKSAKKGNITPAMMRAMLEQNSKPCL